jgi:regulator of replication initiation timing
MSRRLGKTLDETLPSHNLAQLEQAALERRRTRLYHLPVVGLAETALNMSNSPTLPPVAGPQRKPTPLPELAIESDARVQAALAASARAEASLSGLFRAIQQLGTGLGGAREANDSLTLELEGLRDLLGGASEQQQIFESKISELERVLDRTRKEHAQERGYFIDQQDLFLVKLLDEQELELKQRDSALETLRERLAELERRDQVGNAPTLVQADPPPSSLRLVELEQLASSAAPEVDRAELAELERIAQKLAEDRERARETVARLQAQRDEAQSAVARIGKERDDALHEIHRLRSELGGPRTTRPPSPETRRDSSPARAPAGAHPLGQLQMEVRLGQSRAPASSPTASSPAASSASDLHRSQPISSVLSPPLGAPYTGPIPSRLSPPPARLSPPPASRTSPPPEELRRALTSASSTQPAADSGSGVKTKPDARTRPLVGYSLGTGSVAPESLEGATQLSPSPPPSSKKR